MEIQSANFSFLHEHDPELVDLAASAEQFFHIHINTCISTLGKFAEQLAKLIAANRGLSKVPNEGQLELLRRLEMEGIIPSEIADLFHNIRKERNRVVHDKYKADSSQARTLLENAHELGNWFHYEFGNDRNFRPAPFVPPVAPIDPEIERLKRDAEQSRREAEEKEIALKLAEKKASQAEAEKQRLEKILCDSDAERSHSEAEEKESVLKLAEGKARQAETEKQRLKKRVFKIKRRLEKKIPEPPIPAPNIPTSSPEKKITLTPSPSPKGGEGSEKKESKRKGWHHGVIGIVASRLVERYGAPVFIGSYEDADDAEQGDTVRFSVRGIPEFHVFNSLEYEPIKNIRLKGGGHKAAGGFTLPAANLEQLRQGLREFADRENILPSHINPLINIDVRVDLSDVSMTLLQECDRLQPCGLGNADPVFYSENVRVISQQARGKDKVKHLALELDTGNGKIKAIAWRWGEYCPVPDRIDIAYKLRANQWQDTTSVELEVVGIREATGAVENPQNAPSPLQLQYQPAPVITKLPKWQNLQEAPRPLPRPLLLYGHDRPAAKFQGDVDCDRPQKHKNYAAIVLWTLPPSFTHLQWLIATAKPEYIYLGSHIPPIPEIEQFRAQVQALDPANLSILNLLDLAQQWWISPGAIVAALRELGYLCDFPNTLPLDGELLRMQKWYGIAIAKLANILSP